MFTIFLIVAAWNLALPLWLQVCLTVFGTIRLFLSAIQNAIRFYDRD